MSLKYDWQKNLILVFVGICLALGYFTYRNIWQKESARDVSSFTSKIDLNKNQDKWKTLMRQPANVGINIGKANGLFHVEINPSQLDENTIELKGLIIPNQNIPTAKLTWIIFKGFELANGSTTQTFSNLKSGESLEVTISLKKIGSGEAVAHLSIDADINGTTLGGEASFSTEKDLGKGAIEKEMKAQQSELLKSEGFDKKFLQ